MKLLLLDRDGVINVNSKDPNSPYYYILRKEDLILKDGVLEAFMRIIQLNIPVYLVTKQKCISKSLVTLQQVYAINTHLESMISFSFTDQFIEPIEDTKKLLFTRIIQMSKLLPHEICLIDDSAEEINEANKVGIRTIHSDNLLKAILSLKPFHEYPRHPR